MRGLPHSQYIVCKPSSSPNESLVMWVGHPFIEGDFEEQDLFSSYSSGVRSVQGEARS